MRRYTFALLILCAPLLYGQTTLVYGRFFTDRTMRVDYYHTGVKGEEKFSLDRVYQEGPWPGSRVNLVDTLNLGEYMAQVYDRTTNQVIYSRGYSTIFNEWQTTDEAIAGEYRTFSESMRFPYPKRTVRLTISRRDKKMTFREIFSTVIDPGSPAQVHKERKTFPNKVSAVMEHGDPAKKVDIVIVGDGYAEDDLAKFRKDVKRFNDAMFNTSAFKKRKADFNVWMIEVESVESGIDVPDRDVWKENGLGTTYNTFGSARYVLTEENRTLRDIAAAAPYDFICILVNDTRYGGGGIYNLFATTYTKEEVKGQEWQMDYVYVHEFGHSFAGLADEYYTSSVSYSEFYPPGVEPWEPNITTLPDKKNVKWNELLTAGVEISTPWEKARYDSLESLRSKLDRLAPDYYQKREPLYRAAMETLRNSRWAGTVGVFEGAGYASQGIFRPAVDCRMFSLSLGEFDPVCAAAIDRMINFYAN